jgi:hypothetical protein
MKPASFLLCSIALAGCYRAVPVEPTQLTSGMRVVVDLSQSGSDRLRPSIGNYVTTIEGDVEAARADSLTLALTSVYRRGEVAPSTWTGETIHLAASDMERVKRSELSRGRTTAAAVGLGAVGVGLIYTIARATGLVGGGGGGKGPVPTP